MRRRVALAGVAALLFVGTIEPLRAWAIDATPLWLRHDLVALYSELLPPGEPTEDMVPMAHLGGNPYGINVFLDQEVEEGKLRRTLEMVHDAGFGWIKQELVWNDVERPSKGQFVDGATGGSSWAKYDHIVDWALRYDLDVIFRIDTSPAWARPGRDKIQTPPVDPNDYGDFVAAVALRYKGRVRAYQVWNEPNLPFEWGDTAPDAAAYTRLLRIAYQRIHAVDPDAIVLSAALAPTTEFSEHGINDLVYLQQMYDAGAKGSFDVLGANAYGLRSGPDDLRASLDRDVNFSRPILVRRLMVKNGDASRPIWAAEVGWNAVPEGSGIADLWGRVDRQTQAAYTVRAFHRAQRDWPWMGVMNLWHFRMASPNARQLPQYYFNAVDENFQPEPLYDAMREAAHEPRALRRGYHQEDDWAIAYQGAWSTRRDARAVAGGYAESTHDASFTIPFEGTDLELVLDPMPGGGTLALTVDGAPEIATVATIRTAAPAEQWGWRVPVAAGLGDGRHVLEGRVVDGGPVRLDGVVVDRRAHFPGLTVGGLLVVLGAAVVVVASCAARAGTRRASPRSPGVAAEVDSI